VRPAPPRQLWPPFGRSGLPTAACPLNAGSRAAPIDVSETAAALHPCAFAPVSCWSRRLAAPATMASDATNFEGLRVPVRWARVKSCLICSKAAACLFVNFRGHEQFLAPQLMSKRSGRLEQENSPAKTACGSFGKLLREGKIEKLKGAALSGLPTDRRSNRSRRCRLKTSENTDYKKRRTSRSAFFDLWGRPHHLFGARPYFSPVSARSETGPAPPQTAYVGIMPAGPLDHPDGLPHALNTAFSGKAQIHAGSDVNDKFPGQKGRASNWAIASHATM